MTILQNSAKKDLLFGRRQQRSMLISRLSIASVLSVIAFSGINMISPAEAHEGTAPMCNGMTATIWVNHHNIIVGGSGSGETFGGSLTGTPGNDVIVLDDSGGIIDGGEGNDTLCGGLGQDILNGEGGNDWMDGGGANDILNGDNGDDTLRGGDGTDICNGDAGSNTFNSCESKSGNEASSSSSFSSAVTSSSSISSSSSVSSPSSSSSATSVSSASSSSVSSSSVSSLFSTSSTSSIFSSSSSFTVPTCKGLTATIYVQSGVVVGGPDNGDLYTGDLTGTFGNDVIVGTSGVDDIDAGIGNDTVCGNGGNDIIDGGIGNDLLCGDDGNDDMDGSIGNDTLCGGTGNDTLEGGIDNDALDGGDGTDDLDGELGNDQCINGESLSDCENTSGIVPACAAAASSSSLSSIATSGSSASSAGSSISSTSLSSSAFSSSLVSLSSSSSFSSSVSVTTTEASSSDSGGGSQQRFDRIFSFFGSNGSFRGNRTNTLTGVMNFLVRVFSGKSDIPAGAFGGSSVLRLTEEQKDLLCSMQRSLPENASDGVIQWMADYLAPLLHGDVDMILDALQDGDLCDLHAQAVIDTDHNRESIPFIVNAAGFPVSTNPTWNACITGQATLAELRANPDKDEDGFARDCSDYHTKNSWYHPDLHLFFTFDRKFRVVTVPSGYVVQREQAVSLGQ